MHILAGILALAIVMMALGGLWDLLTKGDEDSKVTCAAIGFLIVACTLSEVFH